MMWEIIGRRCVHMIVYGVVLMIVYWWFAKYMIFNYPTFVFGWVSCMFYYLTSKLIVFGGNRK